MQKFMDCFIPSETELKRAAAHLRSLTESGGFFRCYFLPEIGKFRYHEFGSGAECMRFPHTIALEIPDDAGIGYESMEHTPAQIRAEIETAVKMARS